MKETVVEHAAPTKSDQRRTGTAISLAGVCIWIVAIRFFLGNELTDNNAGIMAAIIGTIILGIGLSLVVGSRQKDKGASVPSDG